MICGSFIGSFYPVVMILKTMLKSILGEFLTKIIGGKSTICVMTSYEKTKS